MDSLAERTILLADDVRLDFLEEARNELVGKSRRKWALILIAFVLGAAAMAVGVAFILRRRVAATEVPDESAAL